MAMSQTQLKIMRDIVNVAIDAGGQVFGGYVRDSIILEETYKEKLEEVYENSAPPEFEIEEKLIPSDIDVCFRTQVDYNTFVRFLNKRKYKVTKCNTSAYDQYIFGHRKLFVDAEIDVFELIRKNLPSTISTTSIAEFIRPISFSKRVQVDVIVSIDNPPFKKLDFESNGLMMSSGGLTLCDQLSEKKSILQKFETLTRIVEDIKERKTKLLTPKIGRIQKMLDKRWAIVGHSEIEDGDSCIICTLPFDKDGFRLNCCSAAYHITCLDQTKQRFGSCIQCMGYWNIE
jgi:hypothetical protein